MAILERYADRRLQCAYENACDCLYYGMGSKDWLDCGITKEQRKEVWAVAWYDMGDGCEENGEKPIPEIMKEVYAFQATNERRAR